MFTKNAALVGLAIVASSVYFIINRTYQYTLEATVVAWLLQTRR